MDLLLVSPVTEKNNIDYYTHGAKPTRDRSNIAHATHANAITNASLHFPVCRLRNTSQSRILFDVRDKFPVSQAKHTRDEDKNIIRYIYLVALIKEKIDEKRISKIEKKKREEA